jgi:hypothetical protein
MSLRRSNMVNYSMFYLFSKNMYSIFVSVQDAMNFGSCSHMLYEGIQNFYNFSENFIFIVF